VRRTLTFASDIGQVSPVEFVYRRWTSEDGLLTDSVQVVLQTRAGFLWMGTERGMARFDGQRFRRFDPNNTPALAASGSDGLLWVPTRQGLAVFNPRREQAKTEPVTALIEQVLANRHSVLAPADRMVGPATPPALRLAPGSGRLLEFHYTAASLTAAERLRFRYKLEGYDADWSLETETDLRLAVFTNLPPALIVSGCGPPRGWFFGAGPAAVLAAPTSAIPPLCGDNHGPRCGASTTPTGIPPD